MKRMEWQETLSRRKLTIIIILVQLKQFLLVLLNTHHNHTKMNQ